MAFSFDVPYFYKSPGGVFTFFPNNRDGPGAYDVVVKGKDHFYIQDRVLPDLANTCGETSDTMRCLNACCTPGSVERILSQNGVSEDQLHIALLQLRIAEFERDRLREV